MNEYILILNLASVIPKFKKFRLGKFSKKILKVEIYAENPDEACFLAFKEFSDWISNQNDSKEIEDLLKDCLNDFRVSQLRIKT